MSIDISTSYGGLNVRTPILVGASPISLDESTRLTLERDGAGAIVLPSLFEEQVIEWAKNRGHQLGPREQELLARSRRLESLASCASADDYLALVNRSSAQLAIPLIASMNGYSVSGWLDFAAELEEAGADAIELNVHHPPSGIYRSAAEIEDDIATAVSEIHKSISIPLFLKIERDHVSVPHLARRISSGAAGMVMFGRNPNVDICLDRLQLNLSWGLTSAGEAVKLIAPLMQVHGSCPVLSIAASGGIASGEDVIKVLLAGADVAMITSELYRSGPDVIRTMLDGLTTFLEKHHFKSLRDLQMNRPLEFASDQERAAYVQALSGRLGNTRGEPGADVPATEMSKTGDRWGHLKTDH